MSKKKKIVIIILLILAILGIATMIIYLLIQNNNQTTPTSQTTTSELEDLSKKATCYINNEEECTPDFVDLKTEIQEFYDKNIDQNPEEAIESMFILADLYDLGKYSPQIAINTLENIQLEKVSDATKMHIYVTLASYYRELKDNENEKKYLKSALELGVNPREYGDINMDSLEELKKRLEELNENGDQNE